MVSITNIKFRESTQKNVVSFVDVVINNFLVLKSIRIVTGRKGCFLAFPGKNYEDKFHDYYHPIDQESRNILTDTIFKELEKVKDQTLEAYSTANQTQEILN